MARRAGGTDQVFMAGYRPAGDRTSGRGGATQVSDSGLGRDGPRVRRALEAAVHGEDDGARGDPGRQAAAGSVVRGDPAQEFKGSVQVEGVRGIGAGQQFLA